jgi:hypothetical protein
MKKLLARYGDRLVCVRYPYDGERGRRIKTVELIEEETPWIASGAVYSLKIAFEETGLREKLKMAGARWEPRATGLDDDRRRRATACSAGPGHQLVGAGVDIQR